MLARRQRKSNFQFALSMGGLLRASLVTMRNTHLVPTSTRSFFHYFTDKLLITTNNRPQSWQD